VVQRTGHVERLPFELLNQGVEFLAFLSYEANANGLSADAMINAVVKQVAVA
jgi:hypothetical protein